MINSCESSNECVSLLENQMQTFIVLLHILLLLFSLHYSKHLDENIKKEKRVGHFAAHPLLDNKSNLMNNVMRHLHCEHISHELSPQPNNFPDKLHKGDSFLSMNLFVN